MRVWVVSEDNAGTLNQALGVAEMLTGDPVVKRVRRGNTFRRLFFPFRQDRAEHEPDIIVSCGRISEPFVREMKRTFGNRPFALHLQYPAPKHDCFDLVFVPSQDWRPEFESDARLHSMLGVPGRVGFARLQEMRARSRAKWAKDDQRTLAVLIGGPNKAYGVDETTAGRLSASIASLLKENWRILATVSRRSPAVVVEKLMPLAGPGFTLWDFKGDNPYLEFLAAADALLVTQDSISMASDAAATRKPVYIFPLGVKDPAIEAKFRRFHADFEQRGITRPFKGDVDAFEYAPLDETTRIAEILRQQFVRARLDGN